MTLYNLLLFLHIVAMLGLMTAAAFQWIMFRGAIFSLSSEQSLHWIRSTERLPRVVFPSLLLVLGTGIYMAAHTHAFGRGWISGSFLSILFVAVFSIVGGPATRNLQRNAREGRSEDIRRALSQPLLVIPVRLQLALLLTITFLMVMRTDLTLSLQIVGIGIALGLIWSLFTWRTGRF
jgi:hypothetical protein